MDRFCNAFGSGLGYVYLVAPIVLSVASNVPAVNAVGSPSLVIGGVFVYKHFGARGGQWISI